MTRRRFSATMTLRRSATTMASHGLAAAMTPRRVAAAMTLRRLAAAMALLLAAAGPASSPSALSARTQQWPSFRGPRASGIADAARPPVSWNVASGENVLWKVEIPGVGHSSPVVWDDRIFVTTAVSSAADVEFLHGRKDTARSAADQASQAWRIYCLELAGGRVLWQRTLREGAPRTPRHVKASYANPTPATNGTYVVAFFGSEGLYALDFDGNVVWQRDLGVLDGGYTPLPDAHWGFASSPVIHGDLVIVQADAQNASFIAAFELRTGDEVWRVPRHQDTSWSTPTVVGAGEAAQLVVSGTTHYVGYDPYTGAELWRLDSGDALKISTPIAAGGLILLGGGEPAGRPHFYAVQSAATRMPGSADAEASTAVAWTNAARPHVVTPLAYEGLLYVCTDNGILTLYDLATGERVNRVRVGGRAASFSASPVAAAGNVYFPSEDGEVFVLEAGPEATLRVANDVGEVIFATPAIAEDTLLVRGRQHVFAFASGAQR